MGHYFQADTPAGKQRWRCERKRLHQNQHITNWGECSWGKRAVFVHTPLSAIELLQTLIHEGIHLAIPDLDESAVLRAEHTVAELLKPYLTEIAEDMED